MIQNSSTADQLLTNSNVLLPPAAKRVEFIYFSGPKRSFGRREGAPSHPAKRNSCRRM